MAEYDAVKKQWGSLKPLQFDDPETSLGQRILNLLAKHGSKVAQINDDTGVQFTFDEIRLRSIRVAQNLQKKGFQPRQTIGFLARNCDDLVSVFLAAIYMACPVIPFHPILSHDEITRILEKIRPEMLFCDVSSFNDIRKIIGELKWNIKVFIFGAEIDATESVSNLLLETGEECNFVPVQIDTKNDLAGIFCSSGTTGTSKGVCLTYDHTIYTVPFKHEKGSVIFNIFSIYWTVGVKIIMESIYEGATCVITGKLLSPKNQLEIIVKHKITVLNLAPFDLVSYLKFEPIREMDSSNVKSMCAYGYKLSYNLVDEIKRHFPNATITNSYGLTEIGGVGLCLMDNAEDDGGLRLVDDCVVKIVDDDGNRCGPNVTGEILVKKSYGFRGYFGDPVATKAALDDEGFFRTGDVGYFNDKEKALLFISDRKKNLLTPFSFDGWIVPLEMEEVLIKMSDIKEVCVVGVPIVHETHFPAAVVVRQPGSKLSQNDVFNYAAERFPIRAKLRGGIYFVDELPKTHNGKLRRQEITDLATQRFQTAKMNDPELQSYFADIDEDYKMIIFK